MNTKYSIRILITLIVGITASLPSQAANRKNISSPVAFSYQMHSDTAQDSKNIMCTSGCNNDAAGLIADNSTPARTAAASASVKSVKTISEAEEIEETNSLMGIDLGDVSARNLAVAFFCLMSGALFLLFGLKGW